MLHDFISAQKSAFADYTELRAQRNSSQAVVLLAGNMATNTQSTTSGVSARVYRGGTFGFASSAEYSEASVKDVIEAATRNAAFMDANVKRGTPPIPSAASGKTDLKTKVHGQAPQDKLIGFAKELDEIIKEKYKNLTSRTVSLNCLDIEKLLAISDGADGRSFLPRAILYVVMTAETHDGAPVELYEIFGGFGGFEDHFTDAKLLLPGLDKLYGQLMDKREGVFANAGLRKCVLHSELAGILAHEAVGHTVEADMVLGGSVAADNMNKQVASEIVNMTDFANNAYGKRCPVPVYVDDEGIEAEDVALIENGVLKSFMHSRDTARQFETKPMGNGRAFLFSDEPLIRMRNTAILPGKDKLDEMIAGVDDGYYLIKTGNGQADSTGEFMFSVELGYEIKNGKLGKAIRETTISGVAFEMLKTVDMISDEMTWMSGGFCGKKQPMTVGMGGPALRCEINIGGR